MISLNFKAICLATVIFAAPLSAETSIEGASGAGSTVTIGDLAVAGQLPGAVKLVFPTSSCTGSLIAPDVVLTAAHCVVRPVTAKLKGSVTYTLRATKEGDKEFTDTLKLIVANVRIRAGAFVVKDGEVNFNPAKDMALILLTTGVPASENRVVSLAQAKDLKQMGVYVIAGWGLQLPKNGESMQTVRELMVTQGLTLVSQGSKERPYVLKGLARREPDGPELSVAACHGDSGGPTYLLKALIDKDKVSLTALVAVTTAYRPSASLPDELKPAPDKLTAEQRVRRCAVAGSVSLGASIPANRKWIDDAIAEMREVAK